MLITWDREIKTNIHGKEILFDKKVYVTCILKIGMFKYKQITTTPKSISKDAESLRG